MVDPSTGRLHDPIAPDLHFGEMRTNSSGSVLYGVVHAHVNSTGAVQLVAMNAPDGKILKSRNIDGGVFNISLATLGPVRGGDLKAISPE
jgi:hypothetical protein